MKRLIFLLFLTFFLFPLTKAKTYAKYDPLTVPNNRIGIHILSEQDIEDAAALVNSAGGDWGYTTIVIRDNERDLKRWRSFFISLKKNHLIPLVRIATHPEKDSWAKPDEKSAYEWAKFLNKLPWPTENRYIIVYNEPNHAKEWGDKLDPESYAQVLNNTITIFKENNENFFILPAGLDLAAPNGTETMNASSFMLAMNREVPGIFTKIDGWTSHSYPNPGFSASPSNSGKNSIRGFEWEINFLQNKLGVEKKLPIFITETGWARSNRLTPEVAAQYYKIAFTEIWNNPQIVAITPFLLRYDDSLFSRFAFMIPKVEAASNETNTSVYPQYETLQQITKTAGYPLGKNNSPLGKLVDQIILRRYILANQP